MYNLCLFAIWSFFTFPLATEKVALRFAHRLVHPSQRLRYRTTPHLGKHCHRQYFLFARCPSGSRPFSFYYNKKRYIHQMHISFLATEKVALHFAHRLVHPSQRLRYRTTPHLTETLPQAIFFIRSVPFGFSPLLVLL